MAYPLPRWIAHRGGGGLAPENTLAGLRLAARLGFRAVEVDAMLTADGVPVLLHDETLDRTTDGHGRLADRCWADLAGVDAGRRFHPAWSGEPIPRLEAVLALCADLGLGLNVEIKPASGHDVDTGRVVAETVARACPTGLPLVLSSFSEAALDAARAAAPSQPRALLFEALPAGWTERVAAVGARSVHARAADLGENEAAALRRAGIPFALYTVNGRDQAERCLALGATALFTDRLDTLGPA